MSGLLSPDTGYFRLFSLFSFWRASARLHLKKKKFLENFSVAGACSFHGADFCHNDKEAAVNTRRIYKAFAKVRTKIRPSKPMRVRISSAMGSIRSFWTFFPIPEQAVKNVSFLQPLFFVRTEPNSVWTEQKRQAKSAIITAKTMKFGTIRTKRR